MNDWLRSIDAERLRLAESDNPGRVRTIARRMAGMALHHHYGIAAGDFLAVLKRCVLDEAVPAEVRSAAERLSARLDAAFVSLSTDPVGDATAIIEFVRHLHRTA